MVKEMGKYSNKSFCDKCGYPCYSLKYTPSDVLLNAEGGLVNAITLNSDYEDGRHVVTCDRCGYVWEMETIR